MTLEQAVAGFYQWCTVHGIETDGVRLVLSFPGQEARYRADAAFVREVEKWPMSPGDGVNTDRFNLHGLEVRFACRQDR